MMNRLEEKCMKEQLINDSKVQELIELDKKHFNYPASLKARAFTLQT